MGHLYRSKLAGEKGLKLGEQQCGKKLKNIGLRIKKQPQG